MEKTFKMKETPTPTAFKVLFSVTRGFAHEGRHHKLTVVGLQKRDGVSKATGFADSFQKYVRFVVSGYRVVSSFYARLCGEL